MKGARLSVASLPVNDTANALDVLDDLRAKIISGQVIAFCAVGVEPDDTTSEWCATTRPVTRLRMMGAIQSLALNF